jgi:hypothetical protein
LSQRHHLIAVFAWVTFLCLSPREAMACSCVDWSQMGTASARQDFRAEWAKAEAAVSGTVVEASDLETVVSVGRVLKGQVPNVLRIFRRPAAQPRIEKRGDGVMLGPIPMDCRPLLDTETEYLVLLYRYNGALVAGRCTVWSGRDREQRLRWIPQKK